MYFSIATGVVTLLFYSVALASPAYAPAYTTECSTDWGWRTLGHHVPTHYKQTYSSCPTTTKTITSTSTTTAPSTVLTSTVSTTTTITDTETDTESSTTTETLTETIISKRDLPTGIVKAIEHVKRELRESVHDVVGLVVGDGDVDYPQNVQCWRSGKCPHKVAKTTQTVTTTFVPSATTTTTTTVTDETTTTTTTTEIFTQTVIVF